MNKKFIEATIQKEGDEIVIVATDETLDRHGEVIPMDSWDVSKFLSAPRLMVDHDHRVEKIVGRAENIQLSAQRMTFTPKFHGLTQLSREVEEMVKKDFLNTVSVGFIPHGPQKDGDTGKNELIEISFVTVPANPNAQRIKTLIEEADSDEQKQMVQKFFDVDMKEMEGSIRFKSTEVQTLIFSKEKFSEGAAKKWATDHNFIVGKLGEKEASIQIEQFPSEKCVAGSERSISLEEGVKAVVCRNDEQKCLEVDVTVKEVVEDGVKQDTTHSIVEKKIPALTKKQRNDKVIAQALKEMARITNHALHIVNRNTDEKS